MEDTGVSEIESISFLSFDSFRSCRRQWLFRYHPDVAESGQNVWELRRQSKLMPATALVGRIVDDMITRYLSAKSLDESERIRLVSEANLVVQRYLQFSADWVDAVRKGLPWPKSAGLQPIDTHYYGESYNAEEIARIVKLVEEMLLRFISPTILGILQLNDTDQWVVPKNDEPTPYFMMGKLKVYAKYDFLVVSNSQGKVFDWKTGNVLTGEKSALEQLTGYAMYVNSQYGIDLEHISLHPTWLGVGQITNYNVDPVAVSALTLAWTKQVDTQKINLEKLNEGHHSLDDLFPPTEQKWMCNSCIFRLCSVHPKQVARV